MKASGVSRLIDGAQRFNFENVGLVGQRSTSEHFSELGEDPALPLICIGGSADAHGPEELRNAGFSSCLPKPFVLKDLRAAISAALEA